MENQSKILKPGYINIYSDLNSRELRQIKYKERYKVDNPAWDEILVYLAKYFKEIPSENLTVLDAGCGNGNYVIDENTSKISSAIGIGVDPAFTSKNISVEKIVHTSLERIPFPDQSFDVITSLWVLEHLENPEKVFAEIHRVLKKDGIFMFATPNKNYLPLKIIKLLKSGSINHLINKKLFGREEKDIFPTYYRANTLNDIENIAKGKFKIENLSLNYDPSYSSFSDLTYTISCKLEKIIPNSLNYPHIIGILRKKEQNSIFNK